MGGWVRTFLIIIIPQPSEVVSQTPIPNFIALNDEDACIASWSVGFAFYKPQKIAD